MSTVIDFATRRSVAAIEPAAAPPEHPIWSVDELARIRSDPSFAEAEFTRVAKDLKRVGRGLAFPDNLDGIVFEFRLLELDALGSILRLESANPRKDPRNIEESEGAAERLESAISTAQRAIEQLSEARAVLRSVPEAHPSP